MVTAVAPGGDGHGATTQPLMVTAVAPIGPGHGVSSHPLCPPRWHLMGMAMRHQPNRSHPGVGACGASSSASSSLLGWQRDRRTDGGWAEHRQMDGWMEAALGQLRDVGTAGGTGQGAVGSGNGDRRWPHGSGWWPGGGGGVAMAVAAGAQLWPDPLFPSPCAGGGTGGLPATPSPPLCAAGAGAADGWLGDAGLGQGTWRHQAACCGGLGLPPHPAGAGERSGRGSSVPKLPPP